VEPKDRTGMSPLLKMPRSGPMKTTAKWATETKPKGKSFFFKGKTHPDARKWSINFY